MTRAVTRTCTGIALARAGGAPLLVAACGRAPGRRGGGGRAPRHRCVAIAAELRERRSGAAGRIGGPPPGGDARRGSRRGRRPTRRRSGGRAASCRGWAAPRACTARARLRDPPGRAGNFADQLLAIEAQTDSAPGRSVPGPDRAAAVRRQPRGPPARSLRGRGRRPDVWLTSRVNAKKILQFLDDFDVELIGNGHVELSVYVRAHRATLRLTEHKTVVWLAEERALEAEVTGWLRELGVPRISAPPSLVTAGSAPHFHYRPAKSRDRKKLGQELYRQRLRRVDVVERGPAPDEQHYPTRRGDRATSSGAGARPTRRRNRPRSAARSRSGGRAVPPPGRAGHEQRAARRDRGGRGARRCRARTVSPPGPRPMAGSSGSPRYGAIARIEDSLAAGRPRR